ncbi:MAG: Flp family type IVb pilin [Bdellovibrionales bacterium]|nr:Flp family type IVb pilin [Bdellovibrionales bacterium]
MLIRVLYHIYYMISDTGYKLLKNVKSSTGATLVEYALLLVLIAMLAFIAIRTIGQNTSQVFSSVSSSMTL